MYFKHIVQPLKTVTICQGEFSSFKFMVNKQPIAMDIIISLDNRTIVIIVIQSCIGIQLPCNGATFVLLFNVG